MTSFTARADRRLIRANHQSQRFVLVELDRAARCRQARQRPPVNLAFVLDRSGSMAGDKIRLAKQAVEEAIGRLDAPRPVQRRRLRRGHRVVVESTAASPEACRNAVDRLRSIDARGSTNLGDGWLRGSRAGRAAPRPRPGSTGACC